MLSAACGQETMDACTKELSGSYEGTVFVFRNGTATIATSRHCSFSISTTNQQTTELRNAWANAPYKSDVRPIRASVDGVVLERKVEDRLPTFKAVSVKISSGKVESAEARQAAIWRFGNDFNKVIY